MRHTSAHLERRAEEEGTSDKTVPIAGGGMNGYEQRRPGRTNRYGTDSASPTPPAEPQLNSACASAQQDSTAADTVLAGPENPETLQLSCWLSKTGCMITAQEKRKARMEFSVPSTPQQYTETVATARARRIAVLVAVHSSCADGAPHAIQCPHAR